ncbi:MAG: right-handed parallel beta-helix repeat-containing protein [Verrucomicrobia bacterium]|nr:right-handed parallel beta-helix repeat-containing protein [Verrucomicrobiota bacterium]
MMTTEWFTPLARMLPLLALFLAHPTMAVATEWQTANDSEVAAAIEKAQPGDVIVLKAGRYKGGWTLKPGQPGKLITLRAERPNRVLVGAASFLTGLQPVAGFHYAYSASHPVLPEKIQELDSGKELRWMAAPIDVDEVVGSYCYDEGAKRIFIHPSDSAGAAHHTYATVGSTIGLILADHTMVDGFVMTGFGDAAIRGSNLTGAVAQNCVLYGNGYGIHFAGGKDCVIRGNHVWNNRPTYQEGAQIMIGCAPPAERFLVENNIAHDSTAIGIRFYAGKAKDCMARGNLMFGNSYGFWYKVNEIEGTLAAENNVAFENGNGDLGALVMKNNSYGVHIEPYVKDPTDLAMEDLKADPKFVDAAWRDYRLQSDSPARGKGPGGADPGAFPYKGDVFFVKPDGDDKADGASVTNAWKTLGHATQQLKGGQTLYVFPGQYNEPLRLTGKVAPQGQTTKVRVHGNGPLGSGTGLHPASKAWVQAVEITECASLELANFSVRNAQDAGLKIVKSRDVTFLHCASYFNTGDGVLIADSSGVALQRTALWQNGGSGLHVQRSANVELLSSIAAENKLAQVFLGEGVKDYYGDLNALGGSVIGQIVPGGGKAGDLAEWRKQTGGEIHSVALTVKPIDPSKDDFRAPAGSALATGGLYDSPVGPEGAVIVDRVVHKPIERVEVVSVTSTSANLLWHTPGRMCGTALKWGTDEECRNVYDRASSEDNSEYELVHTVSLINLAPGTTYHFRPGFADFAAAGNPLVWDEKDYTFTTATAERSPRQLYVSLEGNDSKNGLSKATAWRTLHHAARQAAAGDTVTILPGRYTELLRPLQTGSSEDRRITFRAERPLTVFLDGGMIKFKRPGRPHAAQLHGKAYITLENLVGEKCSENIDYGGYRGGWGYAGIFRVSGGAMNEFKYCVADARYRWMVGFCVFDGGQMAGIEEPEHQAQYAAKITDSITLACWNSFFGFARARVVLDHNIHFSSMTKMFTLVRGPERWLSARNSIYQDLSHQKRKASRPIFDKTSPTMLDSDYNCFAWLPESKKDAVEIDEKHIVELEGWQKVSGQDKHSLENTPDYPLTALDLNEKGYDQRPLQIGDFVLPKDSPLRGKASDGSDIGARWEKWLASDVK